MGTIFLLFFLFALGYLFVFKPKSKREEEQTNVRKQNQEFVSVTSRKKSSNSTEFRFEIDQKKLVKHLKSHKKNGAPRKPSETDLAGFYGRKVYSTNRSYCAVYADHYYDRDTWVSGQIALIYKDQLCFRKKIDRPNDCLVTDEGYVICCDWLKDQSLAGVFRVFTANGHEIFSYRTTANLGKSAVSKNSKVAIFNTHVSQTEHSSQLFLVDLELCQIIRHFDQPYYFIDADINTENERIRLKDHKKYIFEIDFYGQHTNKSEYDNQILTKGSVYDKLRWYNERDEITNFRDKKYLLTLIQALKNSDTLYSFGKDRLLRKIGEYYNENGKFEKALSYWEQALNENPRVGIKKRYDSLKKQLIKNETT